MHSVHIVNCKYRNNNEIIITLLTAIKKSKMDANYNWLIVATMLAVAVLVAADPEALRKPKKSLLERRQRQIDYIYVNEDEYRKCDVSPTYLPPTAIKTGERLKKLRERMASNNLAAYIVPPGDSHQSEYIADRDKRRQYMSGFTGSAGLAIVTTDMAALWTDGRYFLQAEMQLDCNWMLMKEDEPGVPEPEDWLVAVLREGDQVGFDPTLMSISEYETYNSTFEAAEGGNPVLLDVIGNLVDEAWKDDTESPQPEYPDEPLLILDWQKFTGETWQQKIWEFDGQDGLDSIRSKLDEAGATAIIISKLDEIAWLFNLRGKDIPSNPMFISYAIITMDGIYLYLHDKAGRLTSDIKTHLGIGSVSCPDENVESPECVTVRDYSAFLGDLMALTDDKIWISDQMSFAIYDRVPLTVRYLMASPVLLMKAVKSPKEIEGMNNAHFKDSIVLCQLGEWMQTTMDSLENPEQGDINVLSELIVEDKALELRSGMEDNQGLSFSPISGFGPNGAVIHYKSSEDTNVAITNTNTFLFDSGSQYLDGTVDITRTFHFGEPTPFMKEAYTRVLLGHIDLALGVFRTGVYGRDIDVLAREPLWRGGLDYKHGTGHGIGHFLNVHEEPARIRIGYRPNEEPLELGMFQSDEPGYYEDNAFGIRIEDIMYTVEADTDHEFSGYTYMTWKMCSLVPLEPKLINFEMFSPREIDWYNAYNQRIRTELGPDLMNLDDNNAAYNWMYSKTSPVEYTYSIRVTPTIVPTTVPDPMTTDKASHLSSTYLPLFICAFIVAHLYCQ